MRIFKVLLIAFFSLLTLQPAFAQPQLSDRASVTLLTCGPGAELYSIFGHTAIRVYDPENAVDTVYNFGTFDFDTPNFYLKFIKGDLQYFVSVSSYNDFVYQYKYYNRDVYEQILNLNTLQKQNIYNELNEILLSDRKFYTYKFIDRNCTTMVADIINKYIDTEISHQVADMGKTNRKIIYERLDNLFYESLCINIMFGYKTDTELYKLFLPNQLMEGVSKTVTSNGNLVQETHTIYQSVEGKSENSAWWNNYYTYAAIVIILIAATRSKTFMLSYLTVAGILGIFLSLVGFYSLHQEVLQNYNTLLFNPLFIPLVFFIFLKKNKAIKYTIYTCFALMAVYALFMVNKPHITMMLPLIILHSIILLRTVKNLNIKNVSI